MVMLFTHFMKVSRVYVSVDPEKRAGENNPYSKSQVRVNSSAAI